VAQTVVFIHTVPLLLPVFDRLAAELLPGVRVLSILDEPLLERVRQRGTVAAEDGARLAAHVAEAHAIGAGAVLVTCSTVSPAVDLIGAAPLPVLKIDAAMVAEAVRLGPRIGVIATSRTTLEPTRQLLAAEAARTGRDVQIEMRFVEGAFAALLGGDGETHDALVKAEALDLAGRSDVIVLAQASVARVLAAFPEAERPIPILSSPHLVLTRLKEVLGGVEGS
jgi:Asp/Glu/hydantoin racemase